jgi:hypothetical protein
MGVRVRTDLYGASNHIGDLGLVEQGERAPPMRQVPLVRSTEETAHDENDRGYTVPLEERERGLVEICVSVVERHEERSSRQPTVPVEIPHEFVRLHEPIACPLQRIQLAVELSRRHTVRPEHRVPRQVVDGVIAEHAQRMRTQHSSGTMDAAPVLDRPDREE